MSVLNRETSRTGAQREKRRALQEFVIRFSCHCVLVMFIPLQAEITDCSCKLGSGTLPASELLCNRLFFRASSSVDDVRSWSLPFSSSRSRRTFGECRAWTRYSKTNNTTACCLASACSELWLSLRLPRKQIKSFTLLFKLDQLRTPAWSPFPRVELRGSQQNTHLKHARQHADLTSSTMPSVAEISGGPQHIIKGINNTA